MQRIKNFETSFDVKDSELVAVWRQNTLFQWLPVNLHFIIINSLSRSDICGSYLFNKWLYLWSRWIELSVKVSEVAPGEDFKAKNSNSQQIISVRI